MKTIQDAFLAHGFNTKIYNDLPQRLGIAYANFSDFGLNTECGEECLKILGKTKELLEMLDPAVHQDVWQLTIKSAAIVCLG